MNLKTVYTFTESVKKNIWITEKILQHFFYWFKIQFDINVWFQFDWMNIKCVALFAFSNIFHSHDVRQKWIDYNIYLFKCLMKTVCLTKLYFSFNYQFILTFLLQMIIELIVQEKYNCSNVINYRNLTRNISKI